MHLAIESAQQGIREKEGGPFGACIVKNGKVVSVAHNTVLKERDPTCHAEMNAIRLASKALDTHILEGCELYTTAEPCPMCLAAIYWARIDRIFVGAPKECAARYGFDDAFFYEQLQLDYSARAVPQEQSIEEAGCEAVFAEWKQSQGTLY